VAAEVILISIIHYYNTMKAWRPSLDDVERISYGKRANKRGTGSYNICHRLNQEDRQLYNQAKSNKYLITKGTAYRRRRKGSPVVNTYRQRCDALDQVCIIIEKHSGFDKIKIDISTLRLQDDTDCILQIYNMINEKYPELMEYTTNECIGIPKVDECVLKTKAIWNIDPRCIVIEMISDRTVAKSIAEDVLKEKFTYVEIVKSDNNESSGYYDEDILLDTELDVARKEEEEHINTKEDVATLDEIDWDDI